MFDALADQHGLIEARHAREAGCGRHDLARLLGSGHWVRLTRGWYVLGHALEPEVFDSPAERRRTHHAVLARAYIRAFDGRAVASHHSALVLHELPVFAADLRQVHLTRSHDDHSRSRHGLSLHERVVDAATVDGVMEPAVAIVQAGMVNGAMAALVAADAALHREKVATAELERAGALLGGPRVIEVRRALARADGRAESPGETRLREAVRLMGLSATPQVTIRDGSFVAVVDLALDEARVVLEFDGFVKYSRPDPWSTASAPVDVLVAEKIREDHVRALPYVVVRVIWSDLDDLVTLRRRIMSAIDLARTLHAA